MEWIEWTNYQDMTQLKLSVVKLLLVEKKVALHIKCASRISSISFWMGLHIKKKGKVIYTMTHSLIHFGKLHMYFTTSRPGLRLENISGRFRPHSACCKPRPISFRTFTFICCYLLTCRSLRNVFETLSAVNKFTRSKWTQRDISGGINENRCLKLRVRVHSSQSTVNTNCFKFYEMLRWN